MITRNKVLFLSNEVHTGRLQNACFSKRDTIFLPVLPTLNISRRSLWHSRRDRRCAMIRIISDEIKNALHSSAFQSLEDSNVLEGFNNFRYLQRKQFVRMRSNLFPDVIIGLDLPTSSFSRNGSIYTYWTPRLPQDILLQCRYFRDWLFFDY